MIVNKLTDNTLEEQIARAEAAWLERWTRGPQAIAWDTMPPQVGDTAPDFELPDSDGDVKTLSSFWNDRPALVIFWRHFGCGCGVDRASRLREEMAGYEGAGANVVIVGQGAPVQAAAYAREQQLSCPILTDPDESAYRAYGLVEGNVSQVLFDAPEEMWGHDRATGEAFIESRRKTGRPAVDNPWLLPGEFVIDTSGTIRLAYRYQYCEDWPNPLVLTAAIKEAGV